MMEIDPLGKRLFAMCHDLLTVSVVVPVHNGQETIRPCLEALVAGVGGPPEVVVVDDASTDETAALVEQYPVRLLRLESTRGPAGARNRGAELATGRIVLFVDADVEVRPDTVTRVAEQFRDHPELAALFGSYDDKPAASDFFSQYRNLLHHAVHQQGWEEAETYWSGCGAVRKDIFLTMGGFSESYGSPSIEDIELGGRMIAAGHRIRLVKDLQVKHLKQWHLLEIIRTDMCSRAIPWTRLILSGHQRGGGLNLQLRYRLSAAAVGLTLAALGGAVLWHPGLIAVALLFICWFLYLNRGLLLTFHRCRGPFFSLLTVPMLLLYYLYSSVAFGAGVVLHLIGRKPD
jgi:cellulose synthase/poly-beta-1,6-N-acetylglucosamine synthase-like glycosyltransferase